MNEQDKAVPVIGVFRAMKVIAALCHYNCHHLRIPLLPLINQMHIIMVFKVFHFLFCDVASLQMG